MERGITMKKSLRFVSAVLCIALLVSMSTVALGAVGDEFSWSYRFMRYIDTDDSHRQISDNKGTITASWAHTDSGEASTMTYSYRPTNDLAQSAGVVNITGAGSSTTPLSVADRYLLVRANNSSFYNSRYVTNTASSRIHK